MSLLEEIQNAAVDSSVDLATLLRKCKLLSARLGSAPLADWLVHESNGYPDDVDVPDYRIWSLELKGHFAGPFGSGIRNAPIPLAVLPSKIRDAYDNWQCRMSVANIESVLKDTDGVIHLSTNDLALALGQKVYQNQNCVQAWAEISPSQLVELLNSVRNRVLDFALALWKEAPEAGSVASHGAGSTPLAEQVTQIFNTTVYGGSANLVGSASASTIVFGVAPGNLASLKAAFAAQGVSEKDIVELEAAIANDPAPSGTRFGPRVTAWVGRMASKAADGSWQIGLGAAGNLLATAIARYYGL